MSQLDAASSIAARTGSGDLYARLFRSTHSNHTSIDGALAFRVNNASDNYIRFCSDKAKIRAFLDVPTIAQAKNAETLKGYSLRDIVKRGVATYYGAGNISIDLSIDAHTHNVIRWGSVDGEVTISGMPTVGTKVIVNNVRDDSGRVTVSYDKPLYLPNSQHTSPHTFDGRGRFIFECYHSSGNLMLTGAWEG